MNIILSKAERVIEYIRAHPGCNHVQIEIALDLQYNDLMDARTSLGDRVRSEQPKGEKLHRYYVNEVEAVSCLK